MQDTGFSTGRIQPLPRVGMKTHPYIVHTAKRKVLKPLEGKNQVSGEATEVRFSTHFSASSRGQGQHSRCRSSSGVVVLQVGSVPPCQACDTEITVVGIHESRKLTSQVYFLGKRKQTKKEKAA